MYCIDPVLTTLLKTIKEKLLIRKFSSFLFKNVQNIFALHLNYF